MQILGLYNQSSMKIMQKYCCDRTFTVQYSNCGQISYLSIMMSEVSNEWCALQQMIYTMAIELIPLRVTDLAGVQASLPSVEWGFGYPLSHYTFIHNEYKVSE